MGSDYREQLQRYTDVSRKAQVATADTATINLIAGKTRWQIFIQKIVVSFTTSAAQSLTFQDTGTPTLIAKTPASPALGAFTVDFGPDGYPVVADKGIDIVISGAGLAAAIEVTMYRRLTPDTALTADQLAAS